MVRRLSPVYPLDLLIKGRTGSAEVRFMVDYSGRPVMTSILNATNPAFGQALLADIESNEFMPPRVNGKPQLTLSGQKYIFDGEASLDPTEKRLLAELRKPMPAIVSVRELDKPLVQTRKDSPVYPFALQSDGLSGKAEVEFIVDRDGRVNFPKILSSTQEDFGWAAATAIARWRYTPPTKGGQKVDVRTSVVVKFDHTKGSVTW
ncbi:MAG TPA: energy transducer TonB [Opitutaceae bacterium]|nr:energy transducer TonB [Opitutaceae bacterium]